ncbi:hypothetical protein LL912_00635 [Niabella sp. CC-SYL272]|uniref:hypothetical protein n=1 Tax=Niabella agricola TaxID=2891571 RepID=UPI001F2D3726|nr:hypothetical protein [Niabella agricola]MCF3107273.1 hypothetical protein [Niabella agricola]
MLQNNTFTVCDDGVAELLVNADYDVDRDYFDLHDAGMTVTVDIKSVELLIAGGGIDIKDKLNKKQIKKIEDEVVAQIALQAA